MPSLDWVVQRVQRHAFSRLGGTKSTKACLLLTGWYKEYKGMPSLDWVVQRVQRVWSFERSGGSVALKGVGINRVVVKINSSNERVNILPSTLCTGLG